MEEKEKEKAVTPNTDHYRKAVSSQVAIFIYPPGG
jgi:hypothetical protein